MKTNLIKILCMTVPRLLFCSIFFATLTVHSADTIIYNFTGGTTNGSYPQDSLTIVGTTFFGTAERGGSKNDGVVYKVNMNGSGFTIIHSFAGGSSDGSIPQAAVTVSGTTLYGTTYQGGIHTDGTIYSMNEDGSGFKILHSFAGGASDGTNPGTSLLVSGTTIFGTTYYGGTYGTVFKVNTDGTGYQILHTFTGGASDGENPAASLIISGSTLYGTTSGGGLVGQGTVFKIGTDGTGFSLLHAFGTLASDGASPVAASLTLSGSKLFGTTQGGGVNGGTLFEINTDGSGFSLLHTFGSTGDGNDPWGPVLLSGSTLFGTTAGGVIGNPTLQAGTLFEIGTDGSGYSLLNAFGQTSSDAIVPISGLVLSGSTLYGTTQYGGTSNLGTIYSVVVPTPEPSTWVLLAMGCAGLLALRRRGAHASRVLVPASPPERTFQPCPTAQCKKFEEVRASEDAAADTRDARAPRHTALAVRGRFGL